MFVEKACVLKEFPTSESGLAIDIFIFKVDQLGHSFTIPHQKFSNLLFCACASWKSAKKRTFGFSEKLGLKSKKAQVPERLEKLKSEKSSKKRRHEIYVCKRKIRIILDSNVDIYRKI